MVMFLLPLGDITLIYNVNIFIIYLVIRELIDHQRHPIAHRQPFGSAANRHRPDCEDRTPTRSPAPGTFPGFIQ